MEKPSKIYDSGDELNVNIVVREENMEDKKVFIMNNEELGIADFGDSLDEAVENFRISMKMYLDAYPEKRDLLTDKQKPLLVSRIAL